MTPKDDLRFRRAEMKVRWRRNSKKHQSHELDEFRHKRLAKHLLKLSAKEPASWRSVSFPCQFTSSDNCQVQGNQWSPGKPQEKFLITPVNQVFLNSHKTPVTMLTTK